MNYVANLDKLLETCEDLYNQLNLIEENKNEFSEEKNNIKQALRKLIIAEAIQKKHVICVTGLQGVGKSALMQYFYGLGIDQLPVCEGRGEKIPVMISEKKDCDSIMYQVVELVKHDDGFCKESRIIEKDDFIESAKNNTEDSETMYLEVTLPYRHFNNESSAFLLLPGFEYRRNYWQELIKFSVKTSNCALFVTDYSSYVSSANEKVMEEVKNIFGEQAMICAVTQTDLHLEQNAKVKNQIEKDFNLQPDQVILTGRYTDIEENKKWQTALEKAINKYNDDGNSDAVFNLITDINYQIKDSISEIENKIDEKEINKTINEDIVNKTLKDFDFQLARIKDDWSKRLKKNLNEQENRTNELIEKKRATQIEEHRVKEWGKKASNLIFGENEKDIYERKQMLSENLQENGIPRSYIALIESFFDNGDNDNVISHYLIEENSHFIRKSTYNINKDKQTKLMNNISILLRGSDAKDENGNSLKLDDSVKDTYKILAEIGIYNFAKRYAEVLNKECPEISKTFKDSEPVNLLNKMEDSKKLGLGMFALAGIDFIPDAKFDALAGLAETLSIPMPAMVGIFAGVMGVATAVTLTRDINSYSRKQLMEYQEAVHTHFQNTYNNAISELDESMKRLRELVVENLLEYQGLRNQPFALINARHNLAILKDEVNDLYKVIKDDSRRKIAGYITN